MGTEGRNSLPFTVVSAIPGRVRLRFERRYVRNGCLRACAERLSRLAGVHNTEIVADAASVIVRYAPSEQSLADILREIETETLAPLRIPTASRTGNRASLRVTEPRDASSCRAATTTRAPVAVLHSIPGRMRVHVPELRLQQEVGLHLENGLKSKNGIHGVEMRPDAAFLIVRYDPKIRRPGGILRLVKGLVRQFTQSPPGHAEIVRARDIAAEGRGGLHPLLLPTAAAALAAVDALPILVGTTLAMAALPIAARALDGVRARRTNVDQLDLTALTLLAATGDFLTGSLMTWLIGLGDLIRARTMRRSRRAISEMMSAANQQAWVERDGSIVSVPVQSLTAGDTVLVYPGDQVPVDGVVAEGRGLVDQKLLTGESAPVLRASGDRVFALTSVADGQFAIRVEQIGEETRAARVAALIEEAPLSDTRIQNYAAQVGDRLVLPLFGLAGAAYLITGDLLRMIAVLILDFATGIRVSAPTTILSAMMGAARHGLFIKGGKAVEKLAEVDAVVFDKTGTLTRGEPFLTAIHSLDAVRTSEDVLRLAACAEAHLRHPAARVIVEAARERGLEVTPPVEMEYALGLGVQTTVESHTMQVGSERYMQQSGIDISPAAALADHYALSDHSLIYVAAEGKLIGLLAYSDLPRDESAAVIRSLSERGIKRIVMLTGDNARAAQSVALELGITDVIADAFPEQKAEVVVRLRAEGYTVAVIGDGVNDAPAFARADVGISLAHGADVAKETADILLLNGDLWGLPAAIDLSREAMGILKQNLNLVMGPTAIGLVTSVAGSTGPLVSTLINNGTTVLAGLNGLRPWLSRRQGQRMKDEEDPARAARGAKP